MAKRKQYCLDMRRKLSKKEYRDRLFVSDEKLFNENNDSVKKELRKKRTPPTQVKHRAHPEQVMVWAVFGNGMRQIVFHDSGSPWQQKSRKQLVKEKRVAGSFGISATKRYRLKELLRKSPQQQREWMRIERLVGTTGKQGGVDRFAYAHKCLAPFLERTRKFSRKPILLEDNAQIHKSIYCSVFKKLRKIDTVPGHAPNSCDLNPCEYVWSYLERKVSVRGPASKAELIKRIEEEFYAIPEATVRKWIDSYWDRLEACIAAKGDWVGQRGLRARPRG